MAIALIIVVFTAAVLGAQTDRSRFEVASVKPSVPGAVAAAERTGGIPGGGGCPQAFRMNPGRVDFGCATLPMLIGYAFRIAPDRIIGPDWMVSPGSPRFDISATFPPGQVDQVPEMVQALLADRFKLASHRGTTNRTIYALLVGKGGAKLQPPIADAAADTDPQPAAMQFFAVTHIRSTQTATTLSSPRMGVVRQLDGPNHTQRWEAPSTSLAGLADLLDQVTPLSTPVIDLTGLTGRYQLILEVSLAALSGTRMTRENALAEMEQTVVQSFNDGLRKLGLELERRKGAVESIVVDRIERSPSGN